MNDLHKQFYAAAVQSSPSTTLKDSVSHPSSSQAQLSSTDALTACLYYRSLQMKSQSRSIAEWGLYYKGWDKSNQQKKNLNTIIIFIEAEIVDRVKGFCYLLSSS